MNFDKKFKGITTSIVLSLILVMIISPSNFAMISTASADTAKAGGLNVPASKGAGSLTVQSATSSSSALQVKQTVDVSKISSAQVAQSNKTGIKTIPFYPGPSSLSAPSTAARSAAIVPVNITSPSSTAPLIANQYSGFEGSDYPASCFCTPPDGNLAVGPSHIFQMVNLEGKIWSKSGTLLETIPMSSFFGTGSLFISDPRVVYDAQSGHWFASILATDFSNNGFVFTAVSKTVDPTGSWFVYAPQFANVIPDQPRLQVTDDKVTIVASDYPASGGWTGDEIFWLQKSTMITGSPTPFAHFGPDTTRFHIEPAVYPVAGNADSWLVDDINTLPATTAEYLKASGPVTSLSFVSAFTTPIGTINSPPGGRQAGTSTLVATNDDRILSASLRGTVFTWTGNDACTPSLDSTTRSCVRWDSASISGSGSLLQDIDFGQVGKDLYFPAVSQDQPGSFGVIFDYSSPTEFPSIAFTGQSSGEPFSTVDNPVLVKAGTGPDTTGRHGDYHAVRADPSTGIYYGEAEYNAAGSPWNTFVTINGISTGTAVSHPTTLTLNPISNVPWGTAISVSGKLTDNSASGVGVGGVPITFTSSAGTVIATVTHPDGTFSTTGTAPAGTPTSVNVQASYAGTQFFGASSSAVVSYSTLKHSTLLVQLNPSPNKLPYLRPLYLTSVLLDTSLGSPIAGKTISWNGSGITGSPTNITSAQGIALLTANSKSPPATYNVQSKYAGNSLYNAASSNIVKYTSQRHDTKVILWIPLNVTKGNIEAFGATLMDTSFNGGFIIGQTITFNGTGVPGVLSKVTNANGDALTFGTAPGTAGTWQVQGRFAGNSNYVQSNSIIKTYKTS